MRTLFVCACIATLAMIIGCGNDASTQKPLSGLGVAVIYETDPLADVLVRLHESATGPVVAQAISTADGIARFTDTPNPEPSGYYVSLTSVSDGGWMLDSKFSNPDSGIRLKPLSTHDEQRIDLPRGAVRLLTSTKQR